MKRTKFGSSRDTESDGSVVQCEGIAPQSGELVTQSSDVIVESSTGVTLDMGGVKVALDKVIYGLYLTGYSDLRVAELFGLNKVRLYELFEKYPELAVAKKSAGALANAEVAVAMKKSATGYYVEDEKAYQNRKTGEITKVSLKRHIAPNVMSGMFWLQNRESEYWKNTNKVEHSGKVEHTIKVEKELEKLSDEELEALHSVSVKLRGGVVDD